MKFLYVWKTVFFSQKGGTIFHVKKALIGSLTCSSFSQFDRPLVKTSHGVWHAVFVFLPMSGLCRLGKKIKIEVFRRGRGRGHFLKNLDIFKTPWDISGAAGAFALPRAGSESSAGAKASPWAGFESLAGAFAPLGAGPESLAGAKALPGAGPKKFTRSKAPPGAGSES